MSHSKSTSGSSTSYQHENDIDLWNDLKIFFRLESDVFSDNKIIGSLNFVPKEAFKFIEKFVLIINDEELAEFDRSYRKISITGFEPNEKQLWIKIKAVPYQEYLQGKESEKQYFFIVRQRFPLTPTVSLSWLDSHANLIVRWFHIGDKLADIYVLSFDEKEIYYIRDMPKCDVYQVCIQTLKPGSKHTIEIIARLKNGKETYRSEQIEISIPYEKTNKSGSIIKVQLASGPADPLQDLIDDYQNKLKKNLRPSSSIQPTKTQPISPSTTRPPLTGPRPRTLSKTAPTLPCRCRHPHTEFPGFDHYINNEDGIDEDDVVYE